jgi:hypothetical protein
MIEDREREEFGNCGCETIEAEEWIAFSCESRDQRDVNATEVRFQRVVDDVNRGRRNERKVLAVMKVNFSRG